MVDVVRFLSTFVRQTLTYYYNYAILFADVKLITTYRCIPHPPEGGVENMITIKGVLRQSPSAHEMQIIPLPIKGRGVVLLRFRTLPEFAYLMDVESRGGTFSVMYLRTRHPDSRTRDVAGPIRVICACCKSMNSDLSVEMLERVCNEHAIETVFVRRAYAWKQAYGPCSKLRIVEASDAQTTMETMYSPEIVYAARKPIHERSIGV